MSESAKATEMSTSEPRKNPAWFTKAINTPFVDKRVDVDGVGIHYLLWDKEGNKESDKESAEKDKPGLIFVHGNGAHAHWWAFIAPFFLNDYRVAAIDLAGAGDSDYCDSYAVEVFAKQIASVADDCGFGNDAIIVGHSFGGYLTLKAGLIYRDRLEGIVLVDSAVRPPDFKWEREPGKSPIKPKRVYEDFESAHARFRLMPPQGCENQYILDYIGDHSLMEVEGGWTWKFDDTMFSKFEFNVKQHEDLAKLECRVGVIYGEDSYLFSQEIADYMFKVLDESVPFVGIPEAQHHLFLDQPLAFVSALRTLLAEWRHSRPNRQVD